MFAFSTGNLFYTQVYVGAEDNMILEKCNMRRWNKSLVSIDSSLVKEKDSH